MAMALDVSRAGLINGGFGRLDLAAGKARGDAVVGTGGINPDGMLEHRIAGAIDLALG